VTTQAAAADAVNPAPGPSSLDTEIALLRDARSALRAGNAAHALALLDEHDRLYARGALAEDSAAERIYALCALGRSADAGALATHFLAAHPGSPHAASVRASCGAR
jgi:outer membrane protein assembly factor BamD (BamD/ComL family)